MKTFWQTSQTDFELLVSDLCRWLHRTHCMEKQIVRIRTGLSKLIIAAFSASASAQVSLSLAVRNAGDPCVVPAAPANVFVVDVVADVTAGDSWNAGAISGRTFGGATFRYDVWILTTHGAFTHIRYPAPCPALTFVYSAAVAGALCPLGPGETATPTEFNVAYFESPPPQMNHPTVDGTMARVAIDIAGTGYTIGQLRVALQGQAPCNSVALFETVSCPPYAGTSAATFDVPNAAGIDWGIYAMDSPPIISVPPANQAVCVGGTATFTVVSCGEASRTYQWRRNAVNIPGATSSTLTIVNAQMSDAASYNVVVTDGGGSATSAAAALSIGSGPSIGTQPSGVTVANGGAAVFSVGATASAGALTYQWRRGLAPLAGETGASLTIAPVDCEDDGAIIDVVVSDSCGSATSSAALLDVTFVTGPCPPAGGPGHIRAYNLSGSANGTGWSWRIASQPAGAFNDIIVSSVAGVAPGNPVLSVAQQFADSINARAAALGCPAALSAAALGTPSDATVTLNIAISGCSQFRLYVGADGAAVPSCLVLSSLPACTFNPSILDLDLPGDDCNGNRIEDLLDIAYGLSNDANGNGVPDECDPCPGDLDGSRVVNLIDLATLLSNFGRRNATAEQGDLDGDGDVDLGDLTALLSLFGTTCA